MGQVVRDAKFDLEAIAVACDNDLGPYENILMQVRKRITPRYRDEDALKLERRSLLIFIAREEFHAQLKYVLGQTTTSSLTYAGLVTGYPPVVPAHVVVSGILLSQDLRNTSKSTRHNASQGVQWHFAVQRTLSRARGSHGNPYTLMLSNRSRPPATTPLFMFRGRIGEPIEIPHETV